LEQNTEAKFLDLGCDEGTVSKRVADHIKTQHIFGVEVVLERAREAEQKGLVVKKFDLNGKFDWEDNFFDVVHANQVIEHLHSSDNFLSEIFRILKPGGYAVISTENASSWCNVFASVMGWQIFSLTNFSDKKQGIGNPLALHKGGEGAGSWNHVRIYNIRGLKEYFEAYGFVVEKVKGAGYFPFPAWFGNIDTIHSHFMTFKVRKPYEKS
jgi:SAM-dependent methyltransferase